MADPLERDVPKGQAKGEAQAQQQFEQQAPDVSGPITVGADPELADPELDVPELGGNLAELLFAPTERPGEPLLTFPGGAEGEDPEVPMAPSRVVKQMLVDPAVSRTTKQMLEFLARVRMFEPAVVPPPVETNPPEQTIR